MPSTVRPSLRRRHYLLIAAFAVALVVTGVFGARAIVSGIYWSQHRDMPIEPWMTIGMVARSYQVPPEDLAAALGLEPGRPNRRPIAEIAPDLGLDDAAAIERLNAAIADYRSGDTDADGQGDAAKSPAPRPAAPP